MAVSLPALLTIYTGGCAVVFAVVTAPLTPFDCTGISLLTVEVTVLLTAFADSRDYDVDCR